MRSISGMRLQWSLVALFATMLALASTGCSDQGPGETAQPHLIGATLTPIDSVILEESELVFVSRPNDMDVTSSGIYLVSDVAMGEVLMFSQSGHLVGRLGKKGFGPGEFASPGWIALSGDSLAFIKDGPEFAVEVFDLKSGEWLFSRRFEEQQTTSLAMVSGVLLLSNLDTERGTAYLRSSLVDSFSVKQYGGHLPFDTYADPLLTNVFRLAHISANDRMIAQAFEVSNWIFLEPLSGGDIDSVHLPVARRKGAPVNLLPLIPADQSLGMEAVNHVSQPIEMSWISDSILVIVTIDPDRTTSQYRGQTYLSAVNVNSRQACVDAKLPYPSDPPPVVAVRDGILHVLGIDMSNSDRLLTKVTRFNIDLSSCTWK